MAIGKRIEERLAELGWERSDLLKRVDELTKGKKILTPQALSNLILRDSKRSEWDDVIAEALGIGVLDLVYGQKHMYPAAGNVVPLSASEPGKLQGPIGELVAIAETMNERGIYELIGQARLLAGMHPKAKPNHAS